MPGLTPEQAAALLTGGAPRPAEPEPKPAKAPRRHAFENGPGGVCRRCRRTLDDGWHYGPNMVDTRKWGVNAPF